MTVDMEKTVTNLFDGGGGRSELDNVVLYNYGEKEARTFVTKNGESIYYLSTKNSKDKTPRGIHVGDSSDQLFVAYPKEQLILQENWNSPVLDSSAYDTVYKFMKDNENCQILFFLKDDKIVMIQMAAKQKKDNNEFTWDFIRS